MPGVLAPSPPGSHGAPAAVPAEPFYLRRDLGGCPSNGIRDRHDVAGPRRWLSPVCLLEREREPRSIAYVTHRSLVLPLRLEPRLGVQLQFLRVGHVRSERKDLVHRPQGRLEPAPLIEDRVPACARISPRPWDAHSFAKRRKSLRGLTPFERLPALDRTTGTIQTQPSPHGGTKI